MFSTTDERLHGVLPVLQTPFTPDRQIDAAVLQREIDWAFDMGADGVVVAMVSEILRLSNCGRRKLASLVCQAAAGPRLLRNQRGRRECRGSSGTRPAR